MLQARFWDELLPPREIVPQCHFLPQAKNLLVVSGEKSGCFAFAQHDIQVIARITTQRWMGAGEEGGASILRPHLDPLPQAGEGKILN